MSKKMASILMAYGVIAAVSGILLQKTAGETSTAALPVGMALGALCLIWGVRGWLGQKRRVEPILTIIAATFVALIQAIPGWLSAAKEQSAGLATMILTLLFFVSVGMLLYLVHGERPPEFYNQTRSGRDHLSH